MRTEPLVLRIRSTSLSLVEVRLESINDVFIQFMEEYVCQKRAKFSPNNVAKSVIEFSTTISRERLRPGYGDGFGGAPLRISLGRTSAAKRGQGGDDESRTEKNAGVEGETDV